MRNPRGRIQLLMKMTVEPPIRMRLKALLGERSLHCSVLKT